MLSIQEMVDKTEQQRKQVKQQLDEGFFHPQDASILDGQKLADYVELRESLRNIPLAEFLAKSGTTGLSGAIYLVPDAIYTAITEYTKEHDKVPLISKAVINGWEGGELKIPVFGKYGYEAKQFSGGGIIAESDIGGGIDSTNYKQLTIKPISFGIAPAITNDLIEDVQYNLIDYHIRVAAEAMGRYATDLALKVLQAGTDGLGTVNTSVTGDANITKYTGGTTADITDAVSGVGADRWIANTLITTPEAWAHEISITGPAAVLPMWSNPPPAPGYTFKLAHLDTLLMTNDTLHLSSDAPGTFTDCKSIIFDRDHAMLTGRKRWLQVENYSNPVEDLAGCVISARQDSVTLYNDSIYVLTES